MSALSREFDISRGTGYKIFASLDLARLCEHECLYAGFSQVGGNCDQRMTQVTPRET